MNCSCFNEEQIIHIDNYALVKDACSLMKAAFASKNECHEARLRYPFSKQSDQSIIYAEFMYLKEIPSMGRFGIDSRKITVEALDDETTISFINHLISLAQRYGV